MDQNHYHVNDSCMVYAQRESSGGTKCDSCIVTQAHTVAIHMHLAISSAEDEDNTYESKSQNVLRSTG